MDSKFLHVQDDTIRYANIASLVADWYWQLDADLCYVFHEGNQSPLTAASHASLIGTNRLENLQATINPDPSLDKHNGLMLSRSPIDMTLRIERNNREPVFSQIVAQPIFDEQGCFEGYYGCGFDVTQRAQMEQKLEYLANHDELTGIFNRRAFHDRLEQVQQFVKHTDYEFSLCVLDLDRFKVVNDTAGHAAGDQLLIELVEQLEHFMMPGETLARMGGDEFSMMLESPVDIAAVRAKQMIQAISDYVFVWDSRSYSVGLSIGITSIKHTQSNKEEGDKWQCDNEELLDRADSACYTAKKNGRNQCIVFSHDSEDYLHYRAELELLDNIKNALEDNRMRLLMQRIESSKKTEKRAHYEILLRLESEYGELITPDRFIPVAEQFQIMQDLDFWVLKRCLETLGMFRRASEEISLSINLSGNTLSDQSALDRIVETISGSKIPGDLLCFEFSESTAISNIDNVMVFMKQLKLQGVRFALDNFGAGQSSFCYIRSLPIDFMKIDGYFIRNIRHDSTNRAIATAFVQLSNDLGIATVATSVEDKATRNSVKLMGIDYVQGYGVARPVDVKELLSVALSTAALSDSVPVSDSGKFENFLVEQGRING